jgi:hypothetical protein
MPAQDLTHSIMSLGRRNGCSASRRQTARGWAEGRVSICPSRAVTVTIGSGLVDIIAED